MTLLHATCVSVFGIGVLIRGASGSGKSDLALRLIDMDAVLVADDYCELKAEGNVLCASAPAAIAGKLEIRGYGIVEIPYLKTATVGLVVELSPPDLIERMPESNTTTIENVTLPLLTLDPSTASAAQKIRMIVRTITHSAPQKP